MAIIFDVLVLVILAVSVFFAYKKGLIQTLFSLVGGLAALALAVSMCSTAADWLNRELIRPTVRDAVLTAVNGSELGKKYDEALASVDVVGNLREMPDALRDFLEGFHLDVDAIVSSAEKSKEDSLVAKEKLIESIADPISMGLSKAAALLGLFVVFFLLLFVAARLLDTVFEVLPLGKKINKVGGVVFGIIRAVLIILVFGAVVALLSGNIISPEILEKTLLLKYINEINPILNF
ncbi:MAG: CvpA family protein [Clostridia bacterium]|nr:CvpA family protein [Clostridia bacterium]